MAVYVRVVTGTSHLALQTCHVDSWNRWVETQTPPLKKAGSLEGEKLQEQGSQYDDCVKAATFEQV